jgi:uncharacterized delta-60 repeat protein
MMRSIFWCLIIVGFFLNTSASAQPELDSTFGTGGASAITFGGLAWAQGIAVQSDNKIIMVSSCNHIQLSRVPFCAIRINENGSFDNTFHNDNPTGSPGVFTIFDNSRNGVANDVVIQSDGKVILVGWVPGNGTEDAALVRYNADGTEDSSFGSGGKVLTDVTAGNNDRAEKVALQPDGKILIVGSTGNALFVARYLPDGTLDDSFGKGGVAQTMISGESVQGRSIALQPNGKIVAGGVVVLNSYIVTRFNSNGSTDTTWDVDGIQTIPPAPTTGVGLGIRSVGIQLDGRVVALGHGRTLFRFNSDGSLDTSFDGDGSRTALNDKEPYSMMVSASGKITVVGTGYPPSCTFGFPCPTPDLRFFTARYKPDGSPDTAFSGDGYLEIDVPGAYDGARAVATDPIGRVVVGGLTSNCCNRTYWEQPIYAAARLSAPPVMFVSVSGRVVRADGNPVSGVTVSTQGMTSRTNPFGYYSFDNIETNRTYTFSIRGRGDLLVPKRTILVDDQIVNLDFFGQQPDSLISK